MKVIVNATAVSGHLTGIERYSLNIAKELCRLDDKIHVVVAEPCNGYFFSITSMFLFIAKALFGKYEFFFRAIWDQTIFRWLSFRMKPDVVFFPIPDGLLFPSVKQIVTVHDLHYLHFNASIPECKHEIGSVRKKFYRNKMPHILEKSAAVIAVSESTRQDISKNFSISLSKIYVIPNGYDETRFRIIDNPEIVLKKYDLQKEEYILFVGSILTHKNLIRLVQAYARLNNNLKLVIVGACKDTLYLNQIFECARELNIFNDKLRYLEYICDNDLPYIYNGALVFMLPSLHEGFGVPLIEAMACGIPVITSNCSAMPEVAGNAAIYVDPNSVDSMVDGLSRIIDNEQLRNDLRSKGIERVAHFRWSTSAAALYDIIKKVAVS